MDKLKENAFALSFGGMVIVLLALGYFCVFAPAWGSQGLGRHAKRLAASQKNLRDFIDAEVLPTEDYNLRVTNQTQTDLSTYEDAKRIFARRCEQFDQFFDAGAAPDLADFKAQYADATVKLRRNYWDTFPSVLESIDPDDRADESKVRPFLEVVKEEDLDENPDEQMAFAMKQYWIADAVFRACLDLKIDGLMKVEIIEPREARRSSGSSSSREKKKEEPPYEIQTNVIQANVTVQMRYGQFEEFLAKLLDRNNRVPFLEPESVKMSVLTEVDPTFASFIRKIEYTSQQKADAAKAAGEPKIPEPVVEFKIHLRALDWNGVARKAEKEAKDGDEEDFEDEDV